MCEDKVGFFLQEWNINGPISPEIADIFDILLNGIDSFPDIRRNFSEKLSLALQVRLNSEGGDIDSAMRIGRVLRRLNANIGVNSNAKCFSACVIVLASGVVRRPYGQIGIHRPYFSALNHRETREQVAARLSRLNADLLAYFQEMGQPTSLLDAMRAVPPNRIRVLTVGELEAFMLSGEDPTYQERVLARDAYRYGTTSAELRRREELAQRMCPFPPRSAGIEGVGRWERCTEAIKYAISEQTLAARRDRVRAVCLPQLRGRDTDTLPAADIDRLLECQRNIMIGNSR